MTFLPMTETIPLQPFMSATAPLPAGCDNVIPFPDANTPQSTPIRTKSKTTANATTHHFRYAGQRWTISRRTPEADATWYLVFERDRQRYRAGLGTSSRAHAEAEAKSHIDAFLKRRREDRSGLNPRAKPFATLTSIFAVVPTLPITASKTPRDSYVWSLRWVLKFALELAGDDQVDKLDAGVLSKQTASLYFRKVMAVANAKPSQAERNTWLRTATTFWANAAALFAPLPLNYLRETANLVLPDLKDWRDARKIYFRERVPAGDKFNRPADAIIRRTLVEWVKLGRTAGYTIPTATKHGPILSELDRRNVFIAAGLALACGLRAGEFERARWDWFQVQNGRPILLTRDVAVKNRSGELQVRPLDPFWRVLNDTVDRNGWRTGEFCLAEREKSRGDHDTLRYCHGGKSDRLEWPRYLVGKWLRWLGWRTQKTNHGLRDLAASYVTMKFGLHRAQLFCRHEQMTTTQFHYNQFVDVDVMDDPKRLAWLKWAAGRHNAPDQRPERENQ